MINTPSEIFSKLWVPLFLLIADPAITQEVSFFSDGTDNNYYDQGIVDVNNLGASTFEYTHPPGGPQWNDKVPCSTNAYLGTTSLKFNYTSSPDGNWKVQIFRKGWINANIADYDSLSFYIYSETGLPGIALPLIGLNCQGGSSVLYPLAEYNGNIPAAQWTRVKFPLEKIFNDDSNSLLDFTQAKAIIFNQSENDNSSRLVLIDEIIAFQVISEAPPVSEFTVTGYDSHAELNWKHPMPSLYYRIYASFDGGQSFESRGETTLDYYLDFVPENGRNKVVTYRITSNIQNIESEPNEKTAEIRDFSDDELMEMVQKHSFRYFWEGAHQATGMALERSNGNGRTAASGATGMGLMAMIIAHEREYRPKEEVKNRILMILNFLETCDRFHGAWSHWYNADTKRTQPFSEKDTGGDLVETSFVASSLVALKNYFTGSDPKSVQIRQLADKLWKEIDWTWYRQYGQNVLYWHWSPDYNFEMNMKVRGWNECLITYIMAASSPTHGIPKEVYTEGWARNGNIVNNRTFYDLNISLSPNWGGPLFWIHYTHLGINPNGLKDAYGDYWQEHVNTARIHYEYAIDNPLAHTGYSDKCWGLTASDDPYGYTAHRPMDNDNGTVSPTAALASMPYTPVESMKALKYFYRERGKDLFGRYGPYDAFNDNLDWVKKSYIGIDQGPIVVMIENHRTGLLWNYVMSDAGVKAGLTKLGFQYVASAGLPDLQQSRYFNLYPNPGGYQVFIDLPGLDSYLPVILRIYTLDGKLVNTIHQAPDQPVDCTGLQNGMYLVTLEARNSYYITRLLIHNRE